MRRTLLVVDDQQVNRKLLKKILDKDYDLLFAENGKECLEILKEKYEIISIVLLDIVMPVMNGYEVLEAMQNDSALSKIPVIVSSNRDGDEDEVKALSLGAQDFIAKPYKADIIHHRITNLIKFRENAAMVNKVERDELTGLYNKQFFMKKVQEEIQNNPNNVYDMICVGIEHFKLVNDTYGLRKGDKVLVHIANVIQELCKTNKIVGRFGADNFYGLVPHQEEYTQEMFSSWIDKINNYPIEMEIKTHCGIYVITDSTMEISGICDRAQMAADKNRGKYDVSFCLYDDSMRDHLLEEQFITSHMQNAITDREFIVYYQPKYDCNSEQIAGAEALVRWIQPEKGFMSPGAFIPIFEKNGFITTLDEYVWETACRDIRNWIDKGMKPVAVSVNVSRADIYNPKLTDILLGLVAKYRIPMKYLHLEITESAYTENPKQIISVVSRLRDLGFSIEMDDFGSGYSSLNMLSDMPVDVLKLDMGFIQSETRHSSGKGILSFVISLAKWLDLAVVAEGVETKDQIDALRSMDCNYVQGYYYSKPIDVASFENLIKTAKITEMVSNSKTAVDYIREKHKEEVQEDGRVMLIVDDIELNRVSLATNFDHTFAIQEAKDGKEAMDYLEENYQKVEIVMSDLLMPVMDGFQLLERIRNDERMADLPVIITSQGDQATEEKVIKMGANDFVPKPFNPTVIRNRVANVIDCCKLRKHGNGDITGYSSMNSVKQNIATQKSIDETILEDIEGRKKYFDMVRLVDPRITEVHKEDKSLEQNKISCFSIWGKNERCNNCISLKAYETKASQCKVEYTKEGRFIVIAQYVPYGDDGAVIEMTKKLEDSYIENIFDKETFLMSLDEINEKIEIDELTNVYNRRHFDRFLSKYKNYAMTKGIDIGLAMVDIDYFKNLNDTYGHLVGDQVLKTVSQIIESNIAHSKGDFVSRFGGDEFLIVCMNIPMNVFMKRMSIISELLRHASLEDGMEMNIGISVGCVNWSEYPEIDMKDLVEKADERLYKAKKSGKGRVVGTE